MTEHAETNGGGGPEVGIQMPFGQYKGRLIGNLPDLYLRWLTTVDIQDPWRTAIQEEIARRRARDAARPLPDCPAREVADTIIDAGVRALARRYHPDAGGSHESMVTVNRVADWLRQRLRGGRAWR